MTDDKLRAALDPYQLLHDGGFPWDDVNAIAAILGHYGLDIVPALAASATDEGPQYDVEHIGGVRPLSDQELFTLKLRAANVIEQRADLFAYASQLTEDRARLLATLAALRSKEPTDDRD